MRKRNLLSLGILSLLWMSAGNARAWDEPSQVDGVYQISSASELEWFSEAIGGGGNQTISAELTADIDLTGVEHKPIGSDTDNKFCGVFNGNGHTIKNWVVKGGTTDQAFFGWVRGGATIKNFTIDSSCSVETSGRAAALMVFIQTKAEGTVSVENVVNKADITSTAKIASGLLAAGADGNDHPNINIINCVNAGKITNVSGNYGVGFIGWNKSPNTSYIKGCYNIGEITPLDGENNLFRGNNRGIVNTYDLTNTTAKGKTGKQGLKTDWNTEDPLHSGELCYVLNNGDMATSGIKYKQDLSDPTSIPLPVEDGPMVYEVASYNCDGTLNGEVEYANEETSKVLPPHTYSEETGLCTFCQYPNEEWMTAEEDGYYHLGNAAQVEWFSHMVRDARHGAMNVKLDADIDFGGVENAHMPIGTSSFKYYGHFDGQGHRIKGMILTSANSLADRAHDGQGFFGSVRGGGTDADGTVTNEVTIENLVIDASCSVEHDNNFAAGLVAHINSRNDADSRIIIRNCGNEADVTTTGKNAAGILGCVENTDIGLVLHNLYNKGKIVGGKGESAAICAWTGKSNTDGRVDVEGCWNIGEVQGVDNYGYNLIRRNSNIVPRNMVDLCTANSGNQGKVSALNTSAPIESGELCYLLNGDQSKIVYTQTLGTDGMPVYGTTSGQVYMNGTLHCDGTVKEVFYENEEKALTKESHVTKANGFCENCTLNPVETLQQDDEGYYLIGNAAELEKFSDMVANGGQSADNKAKLTADIDMEGVTHTPIGGGANDSNKFNSVFDGQGHTISNLTSCSREDNTGLFSWVRGSSVIKNIIIDETCSFSGTNHVAAFVGKIQAGDVVTIENCTNKASVTASGNHAAAFVGKSFTTGLRTVLNNCGNAGTVTSGMNACALVSWNTGGEINGCWNVGEIVKSDWDKENGADYDSNVKVATLNLFNGDEADNVTVSNTCDASASELRNQGTLLETSAAASGEMAYKCGGAWKQTIGTDALPVLTGDAAVRYVGDAGYATLSSTSPFTLNGDVKGSIVTGEENRVLILSDVKNVPAGTGIIVEGTYYNMLEATTADDCSGNLLVAVSEDMDAPVGTYVMQKQNDKIGFWLVVDGEQPAIKAGKAYLSLPSEARALWLEGDTETGISGISSADSQTMKIYNMAGQQVEKAGKGIYIVNGKKVIF